MKVLIRLFLVLLSVNCYSETHHVLSCPSYLPNTRYKLFQASVYSPEYTVISDGAEFIADLEPDILLEPHDMLKLKWDLNRQVDPGLSVRCEYQGTKARIEKKLPKDINVCIFEIKDRAVEPIIVMPGKLECFRH